MGTKNLLKRSPIKSPEVVENDLDARELVRVVTQEEEAIVIIQMFMQQCQDCVNNDFDDISFFN